MSAVTRFRAVLLLALGCALPLRDGHAAAPATTFQPDLATRAAVPRHELPAAAVQAALARADQPQRPQRFAVPVALKLPLADGRWQLLEGDRHRWRLRLHSPGAQSLSARLAPLQLPPGAELWVHGARGETAYGPYTAANVTALGFWTPVVPADELVLELRAPAAVTGAVNLEVAEAFHGTVAFGKSGPGSSGSCNIDASCEANAWGAEARSVAHITIANQFICSGQLVNNVQQDQAPLFLTARHCGINHDRGPAESVNFYFNYAAACGQAAPPLPDATSTGATFLADDALSDFALVRINGALPANAYFAGWNATGQGSASGASLHHPSADAMKVSLYGTPVAKASVTIGGACAVDAWEVHWSSGTTEGGSSGGGLWNAAHQLIGVLSGGTASCENPNGADYFGRLDRAWTANDASNGQLKAHLDPNGSCIAAVPGLDPQATRNADPITSGPQSCQGEMGNCQGRNEGGGGGWPVSLSAALLAAWLARRRRAVRR